MTAGPPTDEAVAKVLGVSVEEYKADLEMLVHVSVGALEADELPAPTDSPEASLIRSRAIGRLRAAFASLGPRDLLLLGLHYNEELTYQEISQVLRVTPSRVCQLHGRAIARLKVELEGAPERDDGRLK